MIGDMKGHAERQHGKEKHAKVAEVARRVLDCPEADQEPHRAEEPGGQADPTVDTVGQQPSPDACRESLRHGRVPAGEP